MFFISMKNGVIGSNVFLGLLLPDDINRASNHSTASLILCSGLQLNVGRTIVGSLRLEELAAA